MRGRGGGGNLLLLFLTPSHAPHHPLTPPPRTPTAPPPVSHTTTPPHSLTHSLTTNPPHSLTHSPHPTPLPPPQDSDGAPPRPPNADGFTFPEDDLRRSRDVSGDTLTAGALFRLLRELDVVMAPVTLARLARVACTTPLPPRGDAAKVRGVGVVVRGASRGEGGWWGGGGGMRGER